jgi:hypothetical protein
MFFSRRGGDGRGRRRGASRMLRRHGRGLDLLTSVARATLRHAGATKKVAKLWLNVNVAQAELKKLGIEIRGSSHIE